MIVLQSEYNRLKDNKAEAETIIAEMTDVESLEYSNSELPIV